jgi:hypothetical protein
VPIQRRNNRLPNRKITGIAPIRAKTISTSIRMIFQVFLVTIVSTLPTK